MDRLTFGAKLQSTYNTPEGLASRGMVERDSDGKAKLGKASFEQGGTV